MVPDSKAIGKVEFYRVSTGKHVDSLFIFIQVEINSPYKFEYWY